jgi:hypothetical protein
MRARILPMVLLVGCGFVTPMRLAAQAECAPGIEFYPAGPFRSCTLTANQRVGLPDGGRVYCRHGETIEFYPDGALRACTLDQGLSLQGQSCPQGSDIRLTPVGQLEHCSD